jgi:hypothetical protein
MISGTSQGISILIQHFRYKLYNNGMLLKDFFGNQMLVEFVEESKIRMMVRGLVPSQWRITIGEVINTLKPEISSLCPVCVQGGIYEPVPGDGGQCRKGHSISSLHLTDGHPLVPEVASSNPLWSPIYGSQFFNTGKWETVN